MPGYELGKLVIDAIIALKASLAVPALGDLTMQLSTLVFATIPGDAGVVIPTINNHPPQDMGIRSAPFAGRSFLEVIPMADWTAENTHEMEAAITNLKSGDFGDPDAFYEDGRFDFMRIVNSIEDKMAPPAYYLIPFGISRFKTFHGEASKIVAAVVGAKYSEGSVKNDDRVNAKRLERPSQETRICMRVLDILRGTATCTPHGMMLEVRAKAVHI